MNFVNLTSHPITIEGLGTIKPSGVVTRVALNRTPGPSIGAVRVIKQSFGAVESLPDPKQGTIYLVAPIVLSAIKDSAEHRHRVGCDVFAPDTGPDAIKVNGRVASVRGIMF